MFDKNILLMLIDNQSKYTQFCLAQGISILVFYFSLFAVTCILMISGFSINNFHIVGGIISWILLSWIFFKKFNLSKDIFFITIGITLSIVILFGYLFSFLLDTYFDSQWYHMDAIIRLANGWNPYYHFLPDSEASGTSLYLNHFPKAPWIVEANLFYLTGNLEMAKCTTIFLMIGLFFFSHYFFRAILNLSNIISFTLSFILIANPVLMLSSMSFYVDGHVAVFFFFTCMSAIGYFITHKSTYLYLALISNLLLAHIKLMSSVYAFILFIIIFLGAWFFKTEKVKTILIKLFIAGIITFVLIGFNPFITNWTHSGHPLYPAMGENSTANKMKEVYPINFEGKNTFQKFFMSFFAKHAWVRQTGKVEYKKLFGHSNLFLYGGGVAEISGWGPMMPEISLLLVPIFLVALFIYRKQKITKYVLSFILIISITIFINSEAWLTRYVPQFWLIFIAILFYMFNFRVFKYVAGVFCLLIFLNCYLMDRTYFKSAIEQSKIQKELLQSLSLKQNEYDIYAGWTNPFKYRLWEFGFDTAKFIKSVPKDSDFIEIKQGMRASYRLKKK